MVELSSGSIRGEIFEKSYQNHPNKTKDTFQV